MSTHIARRLAILGVAFALATALGACVTTVNSFPPQGSTPQPPGDATAGAVAQVVSALGAEGLQGGESNRPYRPVEGPLLAAAPRTIVQATLPDDPTHGFIVVYALASPAAAQAAAEDHAAYLAAGIGGGVQYAPGTEFVLRVVGSNVVFFSWLPANSPDSRTGQIADALETVGTGVAIPS